MAQSDARFGYKAKLGRQDHRLNQPFGFTAAPGMLLPIWYDIATPGDSYYMQHDMPLLRSIQFIAPAMIDVKVHYETFFVPAQMIYQPFENSFMSITPSYSSWFDMANLGKTTLPVLDFTSIINDINTRPTSTLRADAFRILDMLDESPVDVLDYFSIASGDFMPDVAQLRVNYFPAALGVYHTIFQYYYRLDDKSAFTNVYCNFDKYYNTNTFSSDLSLFQIHQRPWDFDYYTSIYRSPIISTQNVGNILPPDSYTPLSNIIQRAIKRDGSSISNPSDIAAFSSNFASVYSEPTSKMAVSTAVIRQLFANEKLAMISGRTKKNYDSQVLAHYGVSVPHDVKHDITMIHHDVYDLHVQEVTSLASTSDAPLGELAGKSFAAGTGKPFKFTAPCHGFIMTIFSIEPKKRYIAGFNKIHALNDVFDFPTPEFDRLGNMPMFRYECGMQGTATGYNITDIVGWKERYYWNKRKAPRVTYAFWVDDNGVNNYGSYFLSSMPFAENRITGLTNYALNYPRPDYEENFYIHRACMDAQCVTAFQFGFANGSLTDPNVENWNSKPWMLYARDPFIVDSNIKCKKVSWMSKDGEPIYD